MLSLSQWVGLWRERLVLETLRFVGWRLVLRRVPECSVIIRERLTHWLMVLLLLVVSWTFVSFWHLSSKRSVSVINRLLLLSLSIGH